MSDPAGQALAQHLATAIAELGELVRKEAALVRAELSEKLGLAAGAAAGFALAAALLFGAFLTLLAAVVLAFSYVVAPVFACLIVAALCGLGGGLALASARKVASPEAMRPERTIRQAGRIAAMAREQMR